jgi:hypothetical protein
MLHVESVGLQQLVDALPECELNTDRTLSALSAWHLGQWSRNSSSLDLKITSNLSWHSLHWYSYMGMGLYTSLSVMDRIYSVEAVNGFRVDLDSLPKTLPPRSSISQENTPRAERMRHHSSRCNMQPIRYGKVFSRTANLLRLIIRPTVSPI